MAGSFLKTTFRNLYREKIYAVINVAGLSLAIACCLILGFYLRGELTYDQHNAKHRQIYRVVNELNINGKIDTFALTPQLLGSMLTQEYAEVTDFVRFFAINQKVLMRHEDQAFYWDSTAFAGKNVFEFFDHDFIQGDPNIKEDERFVAVSETFARKYWVMKALLAKQSLLKGTPPKSHMFLPICLKTPI